MLPHARLDALSVSGRTRAAIHPHEAAAVMLLTRSGRLSGDRYAELIEETTSALEILRRERLEAVQTSLFSDHEGELDAEVERTAKEIATWAARGMRLLTVLDEDYPALLRAAHDRPAWILVAGRLKARDERSVAVIGSREATPEGLRTAEALAGHLARSGYTVVSGLAAGIDTAAHTAALGCGGRTVAVIGTGLSVCYPRSNVILQRRIAAQCAVVSQFEPATPPDRRTFPLRNAVMSGLSLASVIVEAGATSGTRIQARSARAQARPVFLFEPVLRQGWARELADQPGVWVVSEPAEVTDALARLTAETGLVA